MITKDVLRTLIQIQIEQNDLALKIAYEEANILHLSLRSSFVPAHLKEGHEKSMARHKATFNKNQEQLRKLVIEAASLPVRL